MICGNDHGEQEATHNHVESETLGFANSVAEIHTYPGTDYPEKPKSQTSTKQQANSSKPAQTIDLSR